MKLRPEKSPVPEVPAAAPGGAAIADAVKPKGGIRKKIAGALLAASMLGAPAADTSQSSNGQMVMVPDGPVVSAFMQDWAFVTIIRGPWASGKSVGCCGKLFMAANMQEPDALGVRRTRWAVVRNTYPDLQETTIKTWLEWFPEEVYGPLRRSRPFMHMLRVQGAPYRGRPTTVEVEVIFLALDDDEDRKKLLSMELTGAWINEAREISKPIIDDVIGRTGRFPPMRSGGPTWSGCFMDTNAPSELHWLPIMMGESLAPDSMSEEDRDALVKPENWHYYNQPGALRPVKDATGKIIEFEGNPGAENIRYLKGGYQYYLDRVGGKTRSWVLINFCNELGQMMAGKPVWPTFDRSKHVADKPIAYDPGFPLLVGIDSTGRNPAAIFAQQPRGRWRILAELIGRDISVPAFAPQVKLKVGQIVATAGQNTAQAVVTFYRDPHQEKGQGDDRNTDQMYAKAGIRLIPAPGGNAIATRTQTVEVLFDHDQILIDPRCTTLIAACAGGYRFRKLKISGIEAYDDMPDKQNGYADPADALQYVCLGGGSGREMVRGSEKPKPVIVATRYKPGQNRTDLWKRRKAG